MNLLKPKTFFFIAILIIVFASAAFAGENELFSDDFESYGLGVPSTNWSVYTIGAGMGEIVDSDDKDGSGKMMQLGAHTDDAVYVYWEYSSTLTEGLMSAEFDAMMDAFDFTGFHLGTTYDTGLASVVFSSGNIQALYGSGQTATCGTYTDSLWYQIRIDANIDDGTFDVLIDGSQTACVDLAWASAAKDGFSLSQFVGYVDEASEGYGRFDNLRILYDMAPDDDDDVDDDDDADDDDVADDDDAVDDDDDADEDDTAGDDDDEDGDDDVQGDDDDDDDDDDEGCCG